MGTQDGKTLDNEIEVVEGMKFDRGYISPYFVTDNKTQMCEMENPLILIVEKKVSKKLFLVSDIATLAVYIASLYIRKVYARFLRAVLVMTTCNGLPTRTPSMHKSRLFLGGPFRLFVVSLLALSLCRPFLAGVYVCNRCRLSTPSSRSWSPR